MATLFMIFFFAVMAAIVIFLATGDYGRLAVLLMAVPIFVVIVDGGDRVFRHMLDMKKQYRLKKHLKEIGKLPRHSFQFFNIYYRLRRSDEMEEFDLKPYRVIAAVYNVEEEWETVLEQLSSIRDKLFIVDDASTDNTFEVVKESGVEVVRNPENTHKPGAILYGLGRLPDDVETVVVIDPDIEIQSRSALERTIYDLQRSDAAACGLYIVPRRTKNKSIVNRCQVLEYELSMYYGREIPHDFIVISGAASIHDRSCLEEVLSESSRSVYAEDFETSLLILSSGRRIYFDKRVIVRTSVPATLKAFTMQRMGWYFSVPKLTFPFLGRVRKCRDPLLRYQFYVYNFIFTLLIHPFRVFSMLVLGSQVAAFFLGLLFEPIAKYQIMPMYLVLAMSIVVFYNYLALEGFVGSITLERRDWPIVFWFPFYMAYQVLVPITIGYLNFLTWTLVGRKVVGDPYGPKVRPPRRK